MSRAVTHWLSLSVLLLVACSRSVVVSERTVILDQTHARELVHDANGSWMPSRSDILEIEKRLPDFIAHHTPLHRSINDDYKQYVGIIRGGRRLVFLSAFSIPADAPRVRGWQSKPIIWGGGGDTVWRIQYDPQQKTFEGFEMNGPL
jgi:hypothetical protein